MSRWPFRLAVLAMVGLATGPRPAAAQDRPYVDPALRALLGPELRRSIEADRGPARGRDRRELPLGASVALDRGGPAGSPRVGILVRLRGPVAAGIARLRAAGAEIGSVAGDIVTARIPLDALGRIDGLAEIERIEAARILRAVNDTGVVAIRAAEIRRQQEGVWYGSAGHGVVVGIYDSGLDLDHDDFRAPGGGTRLLGLWDQTTTGGSPPPGFTGGSHCDPAAIDAGQCLQLDSEGHGTHVAGTAAGDGSAAGSAGSPYRYAGVAPAADILVVKGGNGSFETDAIVDGVNWIFQTALALGRPAVVNLSLGGQFGPRDGTSLFEQALDNLSGPGRIIVSSAGNDGYNANTTPQSPRYLFHASATPAAGTAAEFRIAVPAYTPLFGPCNDFAFLEIWYEGEDRIDFTVVRPDGSNLTAAHGDTATGQDADGMIRIDNALGGANPENGDFEAVILIGDCGSSGPPRNGSWTIRATPAAAASGRPLHLWVSVSQFGQQFEPARGTSGNFDNAYVVGSPTTAREVLAVGAFTTRVCWTSIVGERCFSEREQIGDIARFSSGGPTRDGRLKPEIAAPGLAVVSALSARASAPPARIVPGGTHWILQGTSMAAPHVTGAIALMLQHAPGLSPADIRGILERTAAQDQFTARSYTGEPDGSPNNQWGYGKLDAKAAVAELVDLAAHVGVAVTPPAAAIPIGASLQLAGTPYNAIGDPLALPVVWSTSDPAVATVDAAGLVQAVAPGVALISATADGRSGSARIDVKVPVASVAISPGGLTLVAGEATRLAAATLDSVGGPLTGRAVAWSSSDTLIARVDTTGRVTSLVAGQALVVAESEGKADTVGVDVLAPSRLIVVASPLATAAGSPLSGAGTRLPLLALDLETTGPEAVRLTTVGFLVTGEDPDARLVLVHDLDDDGLLDADEPVLGSAATSLRDGAPRTVLVSSGLILVEPGDSTRILVALELSGAVPNGALFRAEYQPQHTRTVGVRSGQHDRTQQSPAPVASPDIATTVLRPDEVFAMSENPVRSDQVIFNFRERPTLAAVYALTGERVADLLARMTVDGRAAWDLTNDRGSPVAPGVYLVIFRVAGQTIRQKLIIVRPA